MKLTREAFRSEGDIEVKREGCDAVVFISDKGRAPTAIGFRSLKATKPSFNFYFKDVEKRDRYVQEFLDREESYQKERRERKAAEAAARKAFKTSLKVGDVLSYSWGYDQTNVEYFEVVKVYGSGKCVDIREIGQERNETGFMSGECKPVPGKYISGPIRKVVRPGYKGEDAVPMDFGSATKCNPESSRYYSYYA